MSYAIETRRLTRDFGGRGLFDLDLKVERGRVHGFLGPNGAGKTTALRLLLGFLKPDRGASRVMGHDPVTEEHLVRRLVGYVPGELALPEMLTGWEYLEQSAAIRGRVDRRWRNQLVHRLNAEPGRKIGKLSKGNKQKIALIDALQHRPPLLVLDEPTDGLDPLLRVEVRRALREHTHMGGTVFLSSHVVHEIQTMCDDVSIVLDGRLRAQANIADMIADEGLMVEATLPSRDAMRDLEEHGATDFLTRDGVYRFRVRKDPLPALAALHQLGGQIRMLRQGDLEETFLRLYRGGA